jgi:gamma-glutamylcyclotransferase (GGCT)/AIG2-like uncharacterized protein YtfP
MPDRFRDPAAAVRRCPLALVYGTLKRGERNHPLIADAVCHGTVLSAAGFRLDLGDPPAVDRGGRAQIEGDLFAVTARQLARMDELERHPDWYARELVALADGREAWMYLHGIPRRTPARRLQAEGVARWRERGLSTGR